MQQARAQFRYLLVPRVWVNLAVVSHKGIVFREPIYAPAPHILQEPVGNSYFSDFLHLTDWQSDIHPIPVIWTSDIHVLFSGHMVHF